MSAPTVARVTSLSHWWNLFHPSTGAFRLPSTKGSTIQHLDIDLRYIASSQDHLDDTSPAKSTTGIKLAVPKDGIIGDIHLPSVCVVTLRGAEHCCEDDERMDALAEVLESIRPVEVQWLNANNDFDEQLTFSTHLVHPLIIQAGESWAIEGCLRKLVIQGGFPCPNLSAPTPFNLTPATTPLPSPGPLKSKFGAAQLSSLSALPALGTTKPKVMDEDRLKDRAERKRLAEYNLKPRFEFAFGSWAVEDIHWRLDGRYTAACIKQILEHHLKALCKTWPYCASNSDLPLPSLITFDPLSPSAIAKIRSLPDKLDLSPEIRSYIEDSFFFTTSFASPRHARLFEGLTSVHSDEISRDRQARRFKSEMLLLSGGDVEIVDTEILAPNIGISVSDSSSSEGSPPGTAKDANLLLPNSPGSMPSLKNGGVDGDTSDDDHEAMTPDLGSSMVIAPSANEPADRKQVEGIIPNRQASIEMK